MRLLCRLRVRLRLLCDDEVAVVDGAFVVSFTSSTLVGRFAVMRRSWWMVFVVSFTGLTPVVCCDEATLVDGVRRGSAVRRLSGVPC